MKRTLLLPAILMLSVGAFSQFRAGVQLSGALTSANVKSKYDLDFKKSLQNGGAAGAIVQYDFDRHFSVRSGATFVRQGAKFKTQLDEFSSTTMRTSLNYVQVPLHVIYNLHLLGNRIYAGIGGYGAYGVSGNVKGTFWHYTDDGGYEVVEKLKAFKSLEKGGGNLKKGDYGISALVGFEFRNGMFLQASWQQGFSNISIDREDKYKNNGMQLTVGYFL
jgi:hypothetical protein